MMKICLDAGHYGKYNKSPVIGVYYESDMTWKLQGYLKTELEKKGFQVVVTRTNKDVDLALEARGKKSKDCELFLSLHSNAGSSTANYSMACCLINDKTTDIDDISVDLGKRLADKVTEIMTGKIEAGKVYRRAGNGGTDYYGVLRGAKKVGTPAILLEHGFHTNFENVDFLLKDENLKKLAVAEAEIIAEYFGKNNTTALDNELDKKDFKVKILSNALNIRKQPGMIGEIVGTITDHGVYTIVKTEKVGSVTWGKLKSGAGWISLHSRYSKRM